MDLNAEFDRRLAKIDMLKDFIVLYGKKKENIGSLQQLQTTANRCEELMQQCVHCVQQFQQINKDRFEQMMEKVEYTQRVMMNIMEEMDKKDEVMAKENNSSVSKNKLFGEQNLTARKESTTPLRTVNRNLETPCSLADYMKSPFTSRRMKPIVLKFTDFVYQIPCEKFDSIPSYMKGRESLCEIQQFLDTIIIACFTSKYILLPKRREAVAPIEMELWKLYKSQESYFKGKFITQGDICRLINRQIDRKVSNRITILRHIKVITEERKNSAICYIWNVK